MIAGTGTARLNFGFTDYSNKPDIIKAINNLPIIAGSGNDVAGAARTLLNSAFQGSYCPLRNSSQCIAMLLFGDKADNNTAVDEVSQVI